MSKTERPSIKVLWSLQALAFIALFLFASSFYLSFPAYLFLILTEVGIIYAIIKGRKDLFLYLWQLQFFSVMAFCILERTDIFFNARDVPQEMVWMAISFILIIEFVFTILFIYKERMIKKVLSGITVTTILIVVLLIGTICYEGVQIFGDVEADSFLLSSDWRPTPSVPEVDDDYILVNNIGLEITITQSTINVLPGQAVALNYTILNQKSDPDTVELDWQVPNAISISEGVTSELTLAAKERSNLTLSFVCNEMGNWSISLTARSGSNGAVVGQDITVFCSGNGFNLVEPDRLIRLFGEMAVSAAVELDGYNDPVNERTVLLQIDSSPNFRPSIEGLDWDRGNRTGRAVLAKGENFSFNINLVMFTFDEGTFYLRVSAVDEATGVWLDEITYHIQFKISRLLLPTELSIYSAEGSAEKTSIAVYGVQGENVTLTASSPEGYQVFAILENETMEVTEDGLKLQLVQVPTLVTLYAVPPAEGSENGTVYLAAVMKAGTTSYGILPTIFGTVITVVLALLIAVPLSLATAIFLSRYCNNRVKVPIKSSLELIAGIPSVIIGLWAFYTFGPWLEAAIYPLLIGTVGQAVPFLYTSDPTSRCLMSAGVILGFMIYPIVTILSEDAISAVDDELVNASLGMGATRWQTMRHVVMVKAKSGWLSAILLGTGRAIGETMAVLMVMGAVMIIPTTLMEPGATMTSLIAGNFTVLSDVDVPRHALLGIAMILFLMVFFLDLLLLYVNRPKKGRKGVVSRGWEAVKNKVQQLTYRATRRITGANRNEDSFVDSRKMLRTERMAYAFMVLSVLMAVTVLIYIIVFIIIKGGSSIELSYFMEREGMAGREGGFLNAIIGTLYLIAIALLFAVPLALGTAIYITEYSRERSKLGLSIEVAVTMLSSTPSIIYGAFGFLLFVLFLNFGFSLIAGGITLGIMILPIMIAASTEALKSVPRDLRNASYALGVTEWKTITNITMPAATPAITSGLILSMGRGIGETAAVLITAGYSALIVDSVLDPAASLPNMIYQYYDLAIKYPEVGAKVYSVAMVLILIILSLNITAKVISYLYRKRLYGT